MAKFVISFDNLSKIRSDKPVEQHEIIEATDKEHAEKILTQLKSKEQIQIKITKNNIYKGTKKPLNEGKR